MESDIATIMQPLHLIAHVLKQKFVFVQVHLQPPPQQPQQELHTEGGNHPLVAEHSTCKSSLGRKASSAFTAEHLELLLTRWHNSHDCSPPWRLGAGGGGRRVGICVLRRSGDKS